MEVASVKQCASCGQEKQLSEFRAYFRSGHNNYRTKCWECEKAARRVYYRANSDSERERTRTSYHADPKTWQQRSRRWKAAKRDYMLDYYRRHYQANAEREREYMRTKRAGMTDEEWAEVYRKRRPRALAWDRRNRDKRRPYFAAWRASNPQKRYESQVRRRARKCNAPIIERLDRLALIDRDNWTCYLCGIRCNEDNVTLDHIIPLMRGGPHTANNLRVACRSCNCSKGTKLLSELDWYPRAHY